MTPSLQKKRWNEVMRIWLAINKGDNPLCSEEVHFVQTCCQIMKIISYNKTDFIATTQWMRKRVTKHLQSAL
jgi:hypothetical protein